MPVNPKTHQKYTISDNGRNRLHIYGTPGKKGVRFASKGYHVVKMARPKGYTYDPTNTQYYKTSDDGITSTRTYQNGKKVTGPGSIFASTPGLSDYYNQGKAVSELKYGVPQQTLKTAMGRERNAQNSAYGQIAGYYAGLSNNAKDLMGQTSKIGAQTDQQLQQIGADRNTQIQQATPQYGGPLGEIAQRMADTESQSAVNRGAATDAAGRGYNAQVTGNRASLLGNVGASQQIAGQERLGTLRGVGQQALNVYADKIAELERQKALGAVDSALSLRTADRTYGLDQAKLKQQADAAAAAAAAREKALGIQQQNADTNRIGATKPPAPKAANPNAPGPYGFTPQKNIEFWNNVSKAAGLMLANPSAVRKPANYYAFVNKYGEGVAAAARSLVLTGSNGSFGYLTPLAVNAIHSAGASVGSRYKVGGGSSRRPVSSV